jgi:alpha(1,3/1,4) fucosyltransferase
MRPRIKFIDFWSGYKPEKIFLDLFQRFGTKLVHYRPQIIICSLFGNDRFKRQYQNCTKLYYTGENWFSTETMFKEDPRNFDRQIDFSLYDYAISHYWIDDPRHFRLPNYIRRAGFEYYQLLRNKRIDETALQKRSKFCCFVVSNPKCTERNEFFLKLSKYKQVDSYGAVLNNMGAGINRMIGHQGDWLNEEYLRVIAEYKFMITFENSSTAGYTTEKITVPMRTNTIPIYWGDPLISRTFNAKSFINCHDFNDFDGVIDRVIELDTHGGAYRDMLAESWLVDNKAPSDVTEARFAEFFQNVLRA